MGFCTISEDQRYCFRNEIVPLNNEYVAYVMIVLFLTILITFFISDKIFKKWLIFIPFYLLLTAFLVYKAPVYAGGALGVGPTKELVSVWMGILFVIISIIMFIWMTIKEKKQKNK